MINNNIVADEIMVQNSQAAKNKEYDHLVEPINTAHYRKTTNK